MATTTPNFGWPVPTSTDLVKDGATAIEALGDSIDASLLDLKGGTTGQVLSKTSATNMDFTWTTPASGGMTLLTPPVTLSGASTTISSISQSYKSLKMFIFGMTNATADGIFRIAINGGTTTQAAIQIYTNNNTPTGPVTIGGNTYLNTVVALARANDDNSFVLEIDNYTNVGSFKPYNFNGYMRSTTPGDMYLFQSGAYSDPTLAVTSLVFSNAGGNFSTGTVLLYGVN
jgi:hypothetical protein